MASQIVDHIRNYAPSFPDHLTAGGNCIVGYVCCAVQQLIVLSASYCLALPCVIINQQEQIGGNEHEEYNPHDI